MLGPLLEVLPPFVALLPAATVRLVMELLIAAGVVCDVCCFAGGVGTNKGPLLFILFLERETNDREGQS